MTSMKKPLAQKRASDSPKIWKILSLGRASVLRPQGMRAARG